MKRCFLSAVGLGLVGAAVAAERPLKISVTCDRAGAVYKVGETATFSVTAADANGSAATSGTVTVVLDNFGTKIVGERTYDLAKGNPFTVRGTLDEPGFLRLSVKAEKIANPALDSEDFIWSAGFSPEKIRQSKERPKDFDAFWAEARARLAREVPLDPRMEKDEVRSAGDKQHDWYRVSFATFGRRVYAWLAKPKGALPGARLPASVQVPGAGFGRWSTLGSAMAGRITLFFSVFPFEPTTDWQRREQELVEWEKPLEAKWGMKRYCRAGIAGERREDFYYYPVILGFDRAVDWLAAQPDVDRGNIVYHGSSQGGAFGLFLLALNRNFARGLVMVPAITGHFQHLDGRQDGWPRFLDNADGKYHAAIVRNAPYYDGVNFAAAIRCPVRFMVGFADPICAPSAVYSAYNACGSSDKAIVNCVGMGHHVDWNEFLKLRPWLEGTAAVVREKVVRVACIGDSITYGYAMTNRTAECYPVQLARLLGAGYEVRNFGDPGAGVYSHSKAFSGKGPRSWALRGNLDKALAFGPDIVVSNLGINDVDEYAKEFLPDPKTGRTGVERGRFVREYAELLNRFRTQNKDVRIIIWTRLGPCMKVHRLKGNALPFVMSEDLEKVAKAVGADGMDMYAPLLPLSETAHFCADGIHPEGGACTVIAAKTAKRIER